MWQHKHSRAKIFLNFVLESLFWRQVYACLWYRSLAKTGKTLALGGWGSLYARAESHSWILEKPCHLGGAWSFNFVNCELCQVVKTSISMPSMWRSPCWFKFSNWACLIRARSQIPNIHSSICCYGIDFSVGCETPKTVSLLIVCPTPGHTRFTL